MRKTFATACFVLATTLSYAQTTDRAAVPPPADSLARQAYTTPGYHIDYPTGWSLDTSGQMGMTFLVLSPQSGPEDTFRENVNLIVQDLGGAELTLEQYIALSNEQIESMITDAEIISSEPIDPGAGAPPAYRTVFTGKQGVYDLRFENITRLIEGKAYVLTLTTEKGLDELELAAGQRVLESFGTRAIE